MCTSVKYYRELFRKVVIGFSPVLTEIFTSVLKLLFINSFVPHPLHTTDYNDSLCL